MKALCEHEGMALKKAPAMRPTDAPVAAFLARVPDERRRADARRLCALMQEITGEPPAMWGTSIVGFGSYHYRYASGHEGDSALASFSPRSQHLAIYLIGQFTVFGGDQGQQAEALRMAQQRLGRRIGTRVFSDLRFAADPAAAVTLAKRFPSDNPGPVNSKSEALIAGVNQS